MTRKTLLIGLAVLVLLSASIVAYLFLGGKEKPSRPEEESSIAEWTSFFWMCGDGNLGEIHMMECNIHYLEMVENSTDVNLLCVNDNTQPGDTELLKIGKGSSEALELSDIDPSWSDNELNMGDPDQLLAFLEWGADNYPAERYNIHLVNHGGGWRGMCWDESTNDHLSLPEIGQVCAAFMDHTGRKVDILSTEGCLVGMVEFAYEVKDSCSYFVGGSTYGWGAEGDPENDIWYPGNWQYDSCWGFLAADPSMDARSFAEIMGETFLPYGPWRAPPFIPKQSYSDVMAVFDLSAIGELVTSVDIMARHLLDKVQGPGQTINQAVLINLVIGLSETPDEMNTESFSAQMDWIGVSTYTNYDLYDLAYMLSKPTAGSLRTTAADEVMSGIEQTILVLRKTDDTGGHPDAHGISIYLPYRSTEYSAEYEQTAFATDTSWDEFINAVHWG